MSEIYLSLIFYLENQIIIKVKIINKETIFLPAINVKSTTEQIKMFNIGK